MNIRRNRRSTLRPEILPLVDVMFFLLVFFMLFSTLSINPLALHLVLPEASSGAPTSTTALEIAVTRDGAMFVEGKEVDGQELRSMVQTALQRSDNLYVVIKADKLVPLQYLVTVMDEVMLAGATNISLAVEQERL